MKFIKKILKKSSIIAENAENSRFGWSYGLNCGCSNRCNQERDIFNKQLQVLKQEIIKIKKNLNINN